MLALICSYLSQIGLTTGVSNLLKGLTNIIDGWPNQNIVDAWPNQLQTNHPPIKYLIDSFIISRINEYSYL